MRLPSLVRRRWWLGAAAGALVAAALSVRVLTTPLQVSASVADGDRQVPFTAVIELRFTRDMDAASLVQAVGIEPSVPLSITSRGKRHFEVGAKLEADTSYQLRISGAQAASGRGQVTYAVSFRTEPAPQVADVTLDGLLLTQDQQGVPESGKLTIRFSQPMDARKTPLVLDGQAIDPRHLQWAQDGKGLTSEVRLGRSRPHLLSIPQAARNRLQDPMLADWNLSFTTIINVPSAGIAERIGAGAPALIQIENSLDSRPQWGLQQADLIYEYISEGSIPRLTAAYWHPLPELVGPVRSCRLITLQIQAMYKGMIYCSGANDYILGKIWEPRLPSLINDFAYGAGNVFFREGSRYAPHDVLMRGTNATAFTAANNLPAPNYAIMPRHDDTSHAGEAAPQVVVEDHTTVWTYDPRSKQYLKRQDGAPLMNVGTGQIRAKTVIVQQVTSYLDKDPRNSFQGKYYTEYYELSGEGKADIYTGGVIIHAIWRHPNREVPLVYYSPEGEPIDLDTGLTWVHIIGSEKWHSGL